MPQAAAELQSRMQELFGSPVDEAGPIAFLTKAGYKLTPDWRWEAPSRVQKAQDMTQDEFDCMLFLVQEWDFGGINYSG